MGILLRFLLASTMLEPFLHADTLTLRSNAEINGSVHYIDGAFSVTARYQNDRQTKTITRTYDREEIQTLEFNNRDFNSKEPPTDISIFAGRPSATLDASATQQHKNSGATGQRDKSKSPTSSVLAADESNPSMDDVILLRNKTRLAGRLVKIENGQVVFHSGSKDKSFDAAQVATILIAPN
jgi:hypothetical protein